MKHITHESPLACPECGRSLPLSDTASLSTALGRNIRVVHCDPERRGGGCDREFFVQVERRSMYFGQAYRKVEPDDASPTAQRTNEQEARA